MDAPPVRVLGELNVDGVDLRARLDRRARTLLTLLALARGRPLTVDALVDALWVSDPPQRASDQVLVLVSRLRKVLGRSAVVHGDLGYVLTSEVDLEELASVVAEAERSLEHGEAARAASVARVGLALVRGPLPETETDSDWAQADRAAALRLVGRCRRVATLALLETGGWLDALELATADADTDPYDEEAVRLAMRAQAMGGRPALALAAFAALQERLGADLGTDPAPETQALHTAILRGELAPATVTDPAGIVGRSSQIAHLDLLADRVRDRRVRVSAVRGEAGIGKTTLLGAWSRARAAAGDVVLAGACGPLDRSAPLDAVLLAITDHLRMHPESEAAGSVEAAALASLLDPTASDRPGGLPLDRVLGPATLYAAVGAVLGRIAEDAVVVLTIDDAHLAGPALADWLRFVTRQPIPLLIVVAERTGEGTPLPVTDQIGLGPLDLAACTELVGSERAAALHSRSQGNPLFLAELASAPVGELPPSLVEAVRGRCEGLAEHAGVIRAAAVLGSVRGTHLDIELLASVLGRHGLDVLAGLEAAEARNLLLEEAGLYRFRHDLVREALALDTRPGRAALLHREAARATCQRVDADPLVVAEHARLGGDVELAARALREAADRAAARFDHATAAALLDQSLALIRDDQTVLALAQVRLRQGLYVDAEQAAQSLVSPGPEGAEVAAWAAYFDRRFDDAVAHARDGVLVAADPATRARCLMAGGRVLHARGQLAQAQEQLTAAVDLATGADRLTAAAWLGVLDAHRSRIASALELLRPATRPGLHVDHTNATLHALLFTGHALATSGRPADALAAFGRYTDEVDRRHVPRFGGRGVNFASWVLRNLGATAEAVEGHLAAVEIADHDGVAEMGIAALEDLAEERLQAGDPDAARAHLADARARLVGDLVFGWRLEMKLHLLEARTALLGGDPAQTLALAEALAADALAAGVPRYSSVARLVGHQARAALGEPVDRDLAWQDLRRVEESVALEAWWWAGDTGATLGEERWLQRAEQLAASQAGASGDRAATLQAEADRRLDGWRALIGR